MHQRRQQKVALAIAILFLTVSESSSQNVTATLSFLPDVSSANQLFVKSVDLRDGEAWAVGYYRVPVSPTDSDTLSLAYRFTRGEWSVFPTPNPPSNTGVTYVQTESVAIGPTPNFAVTAGEYIATGFQSPDTLMLEFDGNNWQHVITPGQTMFGAQGFLFEAAHIDHDGVVYMGGQFANPAAGRPTASLVVQDGSGFDQHHGILILNAAHRFRAIDSSANSDIWLVGAAGGTAVAIGRAYASRFDGSTLNENSPPSIGFGENLVAVIVLNNDDVWASGVYQYIDNSQVVTAPLFWHWDGSSWERHESPGFANDLVAYASNDIYGVANDKLVHWDGIRWSVLHEFNEPQMALRSLTKKGPNELIAVGENPFGDIPLVANYFISGIPGESVSVTGGVLTSGNVADLADSDNSDFSIRRSRSDASPRTEMVITATSPVPLPVRFEVQIESSVFARTTVNQEIELFNYISGSWEQVHQQVAAKFSDETTEISTTGDLSRFVEPGTRRIQARVRFESVVPRQNFTSNTDLFLWTIR